MVFNSTFCCHLEVMMINQLQQLLINNCCMVNFSVCVCVCVFSHLLLAFKPLVLDAGGLGCHVAAEVQGGAAGDRGGLGLDEHLEASRGHSNTHSMLASRWTQFKSQLTRRKMCLKGTGDSIASIISWPLTSTLLEVGKLSATSPGSHEYRSYG